LDEINYFWRSALGVAGVGFRFKSSIEPFKHFFLI